jgi:hypothetical protein
MLPSRSWRVGFSRAPLVFLLSVVLGYAAFAGGNGAKPETESENKPKGRPNPDEGVTSVPIAEGHEAKGLVLPEFDRQGRVRGKLNAKITKRLDDERIEFKGVKFTTYTPETAMPDLEILMSTSTFNLKTQVLESSERTTVKRSDFEISGDSMRFEMLTRKGTLAGNVKMVVHGKTQRPGNEGG